jgi:hypothetical protein
MVALNSSQPELKNYIASIRTALSGDEDSIMRKLPEDYANGNVKRVIGYLTDKKHATQEEVPAMRSLEREMARDYTVAVNGRSATLADSVENLFVEKKHNEVPYFALDIEVASTQEGGLIYRL